MNKIIAFVIVAISLVFLLNSSDGQATPKIAATLEECKKTEKLSDVDFNNFKNNTLPKTPKTKEMKCFIACLKEKTGQIVDKKLNNDGVLAYAKTLPNYNDQWQKNITEIVKECNNITDADRCELADKLKSCFMEGAKKRGIEKLFQ